MAPIAHLCVILTHILDSVSYVRLLLFFSVNFGMNYLVRLMSAPKTAKIKFKKLTSL